MRRPDKAGGKGVKTQRRKTLKRRNTAKVARRRRSLAAGKETNVARLARERDEALEQLAATSEMLQVISRSPGELEPVFETMLANAARICEARFAILYLHDGNAFRAVAATHDAPPAYVESRKRDPAIRPAPDAPLGRVASTKQIAHIADLSKLQSYVEHHPFVVAAVELGGFRTALGVPLLKDNELVGSMTIFRQEVRPFTDKQIELVKNFAAQAVIAIENTRLLNELRESLQQQTATSEVLKVISSSPGELEPVFSAMLENATRICEAKFGNLFLYEGGVFRTAALYGAPPAWAEARRRAMVVRDLHPDTPLARVTRTKKIAHVADAKTTQGYIERDPNFASMVEIAGARTILSVPMLKEDELIGVITIYRQEVKPFTNKQIVLMTNFASQAVIAIENTRLLNELRESLQQQIATADVLKVISRSTFDLQAVLDTLVESAARLCGAEMANIWRPRDGAYRLTASYGVTARYKEYLENKEFLNTIAIEPGRGTTVGRVLLERKTVHIHDIQADPDYKLSGLVALGGYRTMLGVPMLREGDPIGVLVLVQSAVRPFTDKQIELATTFADQAVIAIENVRLFDEVQARTRELSDSLERQTATSEVLKIISSSSGELEPVFNAMLENATRICQAKYGLMFLYENGSFRARALCGVPQALAKERQRNHPIIRPPPNTGVGLVLQTKKAAQIPDILAEPEYLEPPPGFTKPAIVQLGGARTELAVPMLKDDELVGAIVIYRTEVRPFSDKQIELVTNFAAQAVIAIENARLLNELRESLQQQTATADVLKVISSSPGELEPVFGALLENATRICEARFGNLSLYNGETFQNVALHNPPSGYSERGLGEVIHPHAESGLAYVARTKQIAHIDDIRTQPPYREGDPAAIGLADVAGARTLLIVPMLKENTLVGTIAIYRQEVRLFTDKQIELVKNFAAQAVIAIENTRLLNELRESLQQQTATSDVLKVISRSTFDLQVVLDTLVESAVRLCEDERGLVFRREGETYKSVAYYNYSPEFRAFHESHPITPGRGTAVGRTALEGKTVQIIDILADPEYTFVEAQKLGGGRATLAVPLLREGAPIGALVLQRTEPRPYTRKQIELVETFADQAVIAIENARLLNELRESLQQQTATADVLKVISRSAFDLQTVLDALIETATRMCDADQGAVTREIDGAFFRTANFGYSSALSDFIRNTPVQMDRGSIAGRALVEARIVQVPDVKADPNYTFSPALDSGDFRTALGVPMLREGVPIGVLSLTRKDVRPFTEKQIEGATTFADQAAIAIENVRLFESVEARTRELAKSLEDLRTTQDRLVQTQKLASLGQLTAGIAHEIKNPLNFVNNFSGLSAELIDELQDTLKGLSFNDKARTQVNELTDTLRGNLEKVVQHGKRADAIVKNMLLHSREGTGEHRPVDINAIVEESLNLAYHGARAEKRSFEITLQQSFDPTVGEADVFPQDITRALLNLISNGFYAATKRRTETDGGDYEPTLAASTKNLGDRVEIRIRDNGTGIASDVKEKMFNPFFTTKPTGEGTGLGLSISHDIIVKQHAGSIEVDTEPGAFTEIRIILPRTGVFL